MVLRALVKEIEDKVGLPKFSDVADAIKNLDEAKLKVLKGIINDIGKVRGSQEELALAYAMIKLIAEADMERLNAVRDTTGNLVKLIRYLPKDFLTKIPVAEIIEEIKKRINE